MTQTIIEKLAKLTKYYNEEMQCLIVKDDDLRAIIEQHKRESGEAEPVAWMFVGNLAGTDLLSFERPSELNSIKGSEVPLYTSPQPSHTKLIGELVNALEIADELIGVEPYEHVSQEAADGHRSIREAIAKALEAVKHE